MLEDDLAKIPVEPILLNRPILVVMTHVKIGDFLLLAPHLRKLAEKRPKLTVVIPDILFELFHSQQYFPRAIPNQKISEFITMFQGDHFILDLTYPLLDHIKVPPEHTQLSRSFFLKPQHSCTSYTEALAEYFNEFPLDFKPEPYLDFCADEEILSSYGLTPFTYFTVHSGSDFAPKNWPSQKFEEVVNEIMQAYPSLRCVGLTGPCDQPLFDAAAPPSWFINVSTSLHHVAHILSGSLFHLDNDSGIHHLAGVMDVPSITVWGPTGPGTWGSITKKNFVHWGGPNCRNHCGGSRMVTCEDRVCLTSIPPVELVLSAKKILSAYKMF